MTPAEQQQGMAAYMAYTEALKKAGAFKGSNRLQPVASATTVRIVDGKTQVLDGPFADSKEQLGRILSDRRTPTSTRRFRGRRAALAPPRHH